MYRVHRFQIKMTQDHQKLEQFLNSLEGEVVSIIPNVTPISTFVDFLLIVEKLPSPNDISAYADERATVPTG